MEDAFHGNSVDVASHAQIATNAVNFARALDLDRASRDDKTILTVEDFFRSAAAAPAKRYHRRHIGQNTRKEVGNTKLALWTRDLAI